MLGLEPGRRMLSSFWSDQYGLRIQYVGHARDGDVVEIDGAPAERDFTAVYRRAGRPVAALLVGRPHALPGVRRLIESGSQIFSGTEHLEGDGMTKHAMRIFAALALVALGGLAGFALGAPHGDATANKQKPPPVEVRTQVIRHTVRIHRKPKAPKHPPRAAAPVAAPPAPARRGRPAAGTGRAPGGAAPRRCARARAAAAAAASTSTSASTRVAMTERSKAGRGPGAMPVIVTALGGFLIVLAILGAADAGRQGPRRQARGRGGRRRARSSSAGSWCGG